MDDLKQISPTYISSPILIYIFFLEGVSSIFALNEFLPAVCSVVDQATPVLDLLTQMLFFCPPRLPLCVGQMEYILMKGMEVLPFLVLGCAYE